ncbi:MAG: DMT family transporter [Oligoflexia bacterium]|nr:DMT family transporter [Oligoflexia bacterium]
MASTQSNTASERRYAIVASIIPTVASSLSWISCHQSVQALGTLTYAAVTSLVTAIISLSIGWSKSNIPSIDLVRKNWRTFLTLLLTRHLVCGVALFHALNFTSASKIMFLTKMEPYIVLLWSWLFQGQTISRRSLGLLSLHIVGAILLSTGGSLHLTVETYGDLIVLLSLVGLAGSYLPAQKLAREAGSIAAVAVPSLIEGIVLLPIALFVAPESFSLTPVSMRGWYYLVISVLLFNIIAQLLWFYSLRHFEAWLSSALRCLGPVLAAPIAWLFYDQGLNALQVVGASTVIATSFLMLREKRAH